MPTPDFVLRLREDVGHAPLWLPGVTAVVLRGTAGDAGSTGGTRGTEVLLVRRSDNGTWGPVTGIVDPGEHPATTARREVLEETRVHCAVEALVWVNVSEPTVHANGDHAQYLDHTFRCAYLDGDAQVGDDESTDVGWFTLDRLPDLDALRRERILAAVTFDGSVRLES